MSCPVLQKRREKLLRRDDSPSAHDAAGQEVEIEEGEVETKAGTSAEALTGGHEHGKERDGVESEAAAKRRRKAQALQVVCMCVRGGGFGFLDPLVGSDPRERVKYRITRCARAVRRRKKRNLYRLYIVYLYGALSRPSIVHTGPRHVAPVVRVVSRANA